MKKRYAFLFDLDSTLVNSGSAGRWAFEQVWEEVFLRPHPFTGIPFTGGTDIEIIQAAAVRDMGVKLEQEQIDRFFSRYVEVLPSKVALLPDNSLLPGVMQLLQAISSRDDSLLGLCTGNIEAGARAKLAPFGLNRFFEFGGYGSDAVAREEMTAHAIRRARERGGDDIRVIVIGDSIRDLAAARANGVKVALVGTGKTNADILKALKPDLFFDSFADWETVLIELIEELQ